MLKRKFQLETLGPGKSTNRVTARIPSLVTPYGNCDLKPTPVYTGTKLVGIATMHKSNAIPIFSDDHAVDVANMRR